MTFLKGSTPLVVETHSADVIATLIGLKSEIENANGGFPLRLTISGASETHVLAKELGAASVGVVLNPVRQFPKSWERRRMFVLSTIPFISSVTFYVLF